MPAAFLFLLFLSGCIREEYYRTPSGLLYRVITKNNKDSLARLGNIVKLHFIQQAGDTIVDNNYDKMPLYWTVMPEYGRAYNPLEAFNYGLREGDSIVFIQYVDSMLKKHIFDSLPKYLKRSDKWFTYMKVEKVFRSDSLMQLDKAMEEKKVDSMQKIAGELRVKKYLQQNNINDAIKSPTGVYVQIIQQGTGAQADSGKRVGLKYKFTDLTSGKMFDTNTDTAFHHKDTLSFVVGSRFMIKAIDGNMHYLKEGAHVRMFIPTMSAFGGYPPRGSLKPYDDLLFEAWLLKVSDK